MTIIITFINRFANANTAVETAHGMRDMKIVVSLEKSSKRFGIRHIVLRKNPCGFFNDAMGL